MAKSMLKCTLEKKGCLKKQLSFHLKLYGKSKASLEKLEVNNKINEEKGTSDFINHLPSYNLILVTTESREDKLVLQTETRGISIKIKIHASHLPFQCTAHI